MENREYWLKKHDQILEQITDLMYDPDITREDKKFSAVNIAVTGISRYAQNSNELEKTFEEIKHRFTPSSGPEISDKNKMN